VSLCAAASNNARVAAPSVAEGLLGDDTQKFQSSSLASSSSSRTSAKVSRVVSQEGGKATGARAWVRRDLGEQEGMKVASSASSSRKSAKWPQPSCSLSALSSSEEEDEDE